MTKHEFTRNYNKNRRKLLTILKKNNFIFISISSHFQGFEVIQLTSTFVFWRQSLGNEAVKPAKFETCVDSKSYITF